MHTALFLAGLVSFVAGIFHALFWASGSSKQAFKQLQQVMLWILRAAVFFMLILSGIVMMGLSGREW